MLISQNYPENPFGLARTYLKRTNIHLPYTVAVLELFEFNEKIELVNLEFDIVECKFKPNETITQSFIKTTIDGEVINWDLILVTSLSNWHAFSSIYTEKKQHIKVMEVRPVYKIEKKQEIFHDEL